MVDVVPEVEVEPDVVDVATVEADEAAPLSLAAARAPKPTTAMAPARATPVVSWLRRRVARSRAARSRGAGRLVSMPRSLGRRPFRTRYEARVALPVTFGQRPRPADGQAGTAQRARPDVPAALRRADDPVGDRQPQAGARPRVGRPVEAVEDPLALGGGNARPGVLDRQAHAPGLAADDDSDRAPVGGELAGIVDEDPEEPVEPVRRDRHDMVAGRHGHGDRQAARLGDDPEAVGGGGGHHADVDRLRVGRTAQGVETGEPQEVLEDLPHPVGLAVDPLERAPVRLGIPVDPASERLVWASITETGVRSSWEASALKASCRWRARSIGAATRRPMATAPTKTRIEQDRPDDQLRRKERLLGRS